MGELLLAFVLGEPLALVKTLPCFEKLKKLYILPVGAFQLNVHDPVHYSLLNTIKFKVCGGQVLLNPPPRCPIEAKSMVETTPH
jgi:hypothetical protein